jgi:hypothetical protein
MRVNHEDDIDVLMAEDIDAKGNELWEQGVREALGDKEFERLYPELRKQKR